MFPVGADKDFCERAMSTNPSEPLVTFQPRIAGKRSEVDPYAFARQLTARMVDPGGLTLTVNCSGLSPTTGLAATRGDPARVTFRHEWPIGRGTHSRFVSARSATPHLKQHAKDHEEPLRMTTRNEHFGIRDLAHGVAVPTTRPKGSRPPGQNGDHCKSAAGLSRKSTPALTNVLWLIWKVVVGVFFRRRPTRAVETRSEKEPRPGRQPATRGPTARVTLRSKRRLDQVQPMSIFRQF
jgi:hypothetical protein